MSTFDCTCRAYGPTLYSRGLLETDAEHVQRILSDWEDWPLTDEMALHLTQTWSIKDKAWQAPYYEGMPGCESTTLFCLQSNDLPVFINRNYQHGTHVDHYFNATAPEHRLQGIYAEANQILFRGAWEHYGMKSITMRERTDTGSLQGHNLTKEKTGVIFEGAHNQLNPSYKETTTTYEEWDAYTKTDHYKSWIFNYTMYPKYPGDPI
tara:strand:+ start:775 stop:1398 length:624 start_codon:yes stop_codon:yes gene_type:complete